MTGVPKSMLNSWPIFSHLRQVLVFYVVVGLVGSGGALSTVQAASWHQVRWVIDGDTIVLENGRKVRYIGINAPETGHKDRKEEPYANQARRFNIKMVARKQVRLEYDQDRRDDYGRLLAYVYLKNGKMVNRALLKEGLAHCYTFFPNTRYANAFIKQQREAMQSQKGIWRAWRALPAQALIGDPSRMRFFPATCKFKKPIRIRTPISFQSAWDAFWKGFAPDRRCLEVIIHP